METGIGIGGPRNGIKLSAPIGWDGRIREPSAQGDNEGAIKRYYPGRYFWHGSIPAWVWAPETEPRRVPPRAGPTGPRKYVRD